jgi:Ca2+-binding RTX toxin-like protein
LSVWGGSTGTNLADQIFGPGGNDILIGLGGDDELEGGAGAGQLFGSLGFDYASSRSSQSGVVVLLNDPAAATLPATRSTASRMSAALPTETS